MADTIPYYLAREVNDPAFGTIELFPQNADYLSSDYTKNTYQATTSVWQSLANTAEDTLDKAGDYVWDAAAGVWKSAKDLAGEATGGIMAAIQKWFDFVKTNLLLAVGVLLVVVWVVAKSGILSQISFSVT